MANLVDTRKRYLAIHDEAMRKFKASETDYLRRAYAKRAEEALLKFQSTFTS
jgi:DNA polymerase III alpha subunit